MIELNETLLPARKQLAGGDVYIVSASGYVQVRHGSAVSPTVDLEQQCPEGKAWEVHISIFIVETDE